MGEAPEMQSAKHISSLIQDVAHLDGKALSILDVGCAAGHYLRSIIQRLPEADIIDEGGMLRIYDHWNIYSFGLMEHLVREKCPEARISWYDDCFNHDFVLEEEVEGVGEKRDGTVLFGKHEMVYPIILPWKTLIVQRKTKSNA